MYTRTGAFEPNDPRCVSRRGEEADEAGRADAAGEADEAGRADAAGEADMAGRADAAGEANAAGTADEAGRADAAGEANAAEAAGVAGKQMWAVRMTDSAAGGKQEENHEDYQGKGL